jgi:tRNA (guanine-N7-)-methyltransferase
MEPLTVRSYRIRGTRITGAQLSARQKLWSKYGVEFQESHLDLRKLFPTSKQIIMEIGFGMGEGTAQIARDFPQDGFLGVEVHPPGVGKLMAKCEEYGANNVRIIERDVHEVFHYMLADRSLDGIHLFFPDPWPKKRHNKRRIVNANFLAQVHAKLAPTGFIHIATDWVPYAEVINETFAASPQFVGGVVARPDWRPITRFEGQGITKDHAVTDLRYTTK